MGYVIYIFLGQERQAEANEDKRDDVNSEEHINEKNSNQDGVGIINTESKISDILSPLQASTCNGVNDISDTLLLYAKFLFKTWKLRKESKDYLKQGVINLKTLMKIIVIIKIIKVLLHQ